MRERGRVPLGVVLIYGLPGLGLGFLFFLTSVYLMKYATDVLLVPPAVMGALFLASRVWDAVSDPLVGHLSDRTRSRLGRRRPWLLVSALPMALTAWMLWCPPLHLDGSALVLWMGAALFLHFTATTLFAVPHESLGAELSRDHHDRTRLFGIRHVLGTFGIFLALGGIFLLVRSPSPRATAATLILSAGALTALLTLFAGALLREPEEHVGRGGQRPFAAFADVLRNPHARLLLAVFAIETVGSATLGVLLPYVLEYVVGRADLIPHLIAGYMIPAVLFVPLWIVLARRIGKKTLWLGSMCTMTLAFGALFFVEPGDWLYVAVLATIAGVGGGCGAVVAPSIQADVIDWDELRTGERKEGAYFALWSFVRKGAIGVTAGGAGLALGATGFVPNAEQSPQTLLALRALFGLFPALCFAVGSLLFLRFRFNQAEHEAVQAALAARGTAGGIHPRAGSAQVGGEDRPIGERRGREPVRL
jgi:GPH family glycoside/pentoside/hexuronide:cation symporter